jgi:uncharacterized protein YjiS (DUF1127 family)
MAAILLTQTPFPDFSAQAPSFASALAAIYSHIASFSIWLATCLERQRQRGQLAELDDHMLRDIGITRVEALREAGKPWWR